MTNEQILRGIETVGQTVVASTNPRGIIRWLSSGLSLDRICRFYLITENLSVYLPPGGVQGKTVLDIGAGCGETAWWYFKNGASKVIAIEPDMQRARMIVKNRAILDWNLTLHYRKFRLEDLDIKRDFTKVNIEGYEALLLQRPDRLGPMVVDIHNWYLVERFKEIGFHPITKPSKMLGQCYMANY